jgi:excisionase family DNA binding protein
VSERLTARETAGELGVSMRTLSRYVDDGLIAPERTRGGHRRFARGDVAALRDRLADTEPGRPPAPTTELPNP